jgi:hypothetical protein
MAERSNSLRRLRIAAVPERPHSGTADYFGYRYLGFRHAKRSKPNNPQEQVRRSHNFDLAEHAYASNIN